MSPDPGTVSPAVGWLAFLDIYGFASSVFDESIDDVGSRLLALQTRILKIVEANHSAKVFLFSDSVILFKPSANNNRLGAIQSLEEVLIKIQNVAIESGFVFRGALFHGPVILGANFCLGTPLIKAAHLEKQLYLPLIVIPTSAVQPTDSILSEHHSDILIPTKGDGFIAGYPLLPRPFDNLLEFAAQQLRHTSIAGPASVAGVWRSLTQFLSFQNKGQE